MAALLQERIAGSPALAAATAEVAARLRASTVEVRSQDHGHGSGVIWRADGLIVTNHHVVQTDHPEVVLFDGRTFPAQVLLRDAERDLAALRIATADVQAAAIGDSAALRPGELVLAMGHPLGIIGALTLGIVHAVAGSQRGSDRWIQADISLLPGNSGGPLADAQGRVIGINSMVAGGLALVVPSNAVERFLKGNGTSAFLGVQTQPVAFPALWAAQTGQQAGLLTLTVVPGSPAAQAGLLPGDMLVAAGTQRLTDGSILLDVLRVLEPGTALPLSVLRGGASLTLTAILAAQPSERR